MDGRVLPKTSQDISSAAGVNPAALARPFERHLPVFLVGGDGLVFGCVVASDGGELHSREEEQEDREDRKLREEPEEAA